MKRLLKQGTLPRINTLVDAYNCVSARHRCSLGAHELDQLVLPVELRMLDSADLFIPLGSERPVPVNDTQFGYVDDYGRVICWLDLHQAEFSKVTPISSRVLIIVEGTADHPPEALPEAVEDLIATLERHCGG